MNFAEWLHINEMSSFTIPNGVDFEIPCNRQDRDFGCHVGALDMRFEDPPQTKDGFGRVLNQGSNFVGKIPDTNDYLVYNGKASISNNPKELIRKSREITPQLRHLFALAQQTAPGPEREQIVDQLHAMQKHYYTMLPDNWWQKADILGKDYERISAAQGDIDGTRPASLGTRIVQATGIQ